MSPRPKDSSLKTFAYIDQNFLIACADDPERGQHLLRLHAQGNPTILVSQFHLIEIAKGKAPFVGSTVGFLEKLDPYWLPVRDQLAFIEFASTWTIFMKGTPLAGLQIPLWRIIKDFQNGLPTAETVRSQVTLQQQQYIADDAVAFMREQRELADRNRRWHSEYGTPMGFDLNKELLMGCFHLARMKHDLPLGDPKIKAVAFNLVRDHYTVLQVKRLLDGGGRNLQRIWLVDEGLSQHFRLSTAALNANRFLDKCHANIALPYADLFVTNDGELTKYCEAVRPTLPFSVSEVLSPEMFWQRYP